MSRNTTFMDQQFGRDDSNESDFESGLVFVIMPFTGPEMQDVYSALKDECGKLGLTAKRVDENVGSGFIIREITDLIERAEYIICDLTSERPQRLL